MSKKVNIFSANKINEIKDYNRFSHTKAYLNQKADRPVKYYYKNQVDSLRQLAHKSGYSKFNKFMDHRKSWHELERKIPLSYLKEIEAELETLEFTVEELDLEEYEEVLQIPRFPKWFSVRMIPAYYKSIEFTELFSEKEAIKYVREYAMREERICFINYPPIKSITFHPSGKVDEIYYEPGIKITDRYLIPTVAGRNAGTIKLI